MPVKNKFLSPSQKHVIGIYGGVGPLSHTLFEQEMLAENQRRGAVSDQDHPVWILISASSTPDRTQGLLHGGRSALSHMIYYARLIEEFGAKALFVICNTSHAYYDKVQKEIRIPWVHLMEITAQHIKDHYPLVKNIGIIGTNGTLQTRLYHNALEKLKLCPVAPEIGSSIQRNIMAAIYDSSFGVKATGSVVLPKAKENLLAGANWCRENGAQAIIAACTEVSVGLTPSVFADLPIIDPLKVAARIALDIAYGKRDPGEFRFTR